MVSENEGGMSHRIHPVPFFNLVIHRLFTGEHSGKAQEPILLPDLKSAFPVSSPDVSLQRRLYLRRGKKQNRLTYQCSQSTSVSSPTITKQRNLMIHSSRTGRVLFLWVCLFVFLSNMPLKKSFILEHARELRLT